MGLFYSNKSNFDLVGYADSGYLYDPHKARSLTGNFFTCGGTTISSRLVKQAITGTSSNHVETLAIREASRECVWLRSMTQHIRETCGLSSSKNPPTTLYEDNIEQSIFHQNFSTLMILKKMATSLYNKFVRRITWQTYLQNHYQPQPLKNWCRTLECGDSNISSNIPTSGSKCIVFF